MKLETKAIYYARRVLFAIARGVERAHAALDAYNDCKETREP